MTRKKLTGSAAAMLVLIIATILLVPGMFHATAQEQPLQAPAVQQAKAVQETQYAKRQLRAAWISTAWNIDWPSVKDCLPNSRNKNLFKFWMT
ncbi:hypothetical protein P7H16_17300 [Paenibacillus larvae]|nr:hypothetical protein [Paenibacillus larvae]MDT2248324.1 hypothetical protein [Paenibacillus larvae]